MADIYSPEERSRIMALIKSKNSKAELMAFRYLRHQKVYFQKHYARAPGKPDIALPRKKKAVFIDGEFWHGKDYERLHSKYSDYWKSKIQRNMARDSENEAALLKAGWKVLRVWDKDIVRLRTRLDTLQLIEQFLLRD